MSYVFVARSERNDPLSLSDWAIIRMRTGTQFLTEKNVSLRRYALVSTERCHIIVT